MKITVKRTSLEDIYSFFKPLAETCTWASLTGKEVCVSWSNYPGYMRWYKMGKKIKFEYVLTESTPTLK